MKETDFLEIINKTLSDSSYLGDDCAYLKDFGIFITQDTLVENIHFSLDTITPYYLGRKAVAVNLSDIAASLSKPEYILISISLPEDISNDFVKDFYAGVNDICSEYKIKVVGGDITGSEKIFISITAIGKKISNYISSRSFAKEDDIIITTGIHGSSSCALFAIQNNIEISQEIIDCHTNPIPKVKEANKLLSVLDRNIAVMDSSDGLIDAVYKIALASDCSIKIDFNKVKIDIKIINIANENKIDYKNWVLWGGEDYELVASVPEYIYNKLDKNVFNQIGRVCNKQNDFIIDVKIEGTDYKITQDVFNKKSFNHFKKDL